MKQRLKIITVVFFLFAIIVHSKIFAQIPDTSTTQKLLQYIMQPLDKNQIPTGFLEEYGCPILPPATFNGILTDSNSVDMNLWRSLYFQLQTAWTRTTTNPLPAVASVNTVIKQTVGNNSIVPIPLLIAQYNAVKTNAFSSNLLAFNSNTKQVSDVIGRTQSPYQTNNLFAASPIISQTFTGRDSFICKTNLVWNNSGKTITLLQIDFANGEGFKTISMGTAIAVNYVDTGFKRWVIKATLNDNSVLQCYSNYYVVKVTPAVAARYFGPSIFSSGYDSFVDFAANTTDGGGRIYISYTSKNRTNTIRKPLIVVEGYDVNKRAPSVQTYNYTYRHLIDAIDEPRILYDFNKQLDETAGYDLIFVDFEDGADDIIRNAAFVQRVITYINGIKVNNSNNGNIREENVVMGLSMGGLCARYALANMTKNFSSTPTETRLLITHDSPHQGANVPLGLQYLLRMIGNTQVFGTNILDIYPNYYDAIGLLNAPATQQLLTYRSLTTNTFAANSFLSTTYRNMVMFGATGPQPTYRFIATSLGNECANPLFNPNSQLINVNQDGFIFYFPLVSYRLRTIAEAYALPSTGTSKIARFKLSSKLKLWGLITIAKDYYDNTAYAPGNHLAIDGVPGAVSSYASTTLPPYNFSLPLYGVLGFLGYVSSSVSGTPGNFTFVPVASALDASPYNTNIFSQKYVNGSNQNYPSAGETFIAQETNTGTSNNVHIRFTARNSKWLFKEMENLPNLENCSGDCSNPFYISGTSPVCTSQTFTVSGLQRGVGITWGNSNSALATLSGTGNLVTLTRNGTATGVLTLTANLGAGCGSATSVTKQVIIGMPSIFGRAQYINNGGYQTLTGTLNFTNNTNCWVQLPMPVTTPYSWVKNMSSNNVSFSVVNSQTKEAANILFNSPVSSGASIDLSVNSTNACGTITDRFVIRYNGPSMFSMAPNPAEDEINVSTDESGVQEESSTNNLALRRAGQTQSNETNHPKIMAIRITDVSGNVKAQYHYNKANCASKVKLNIATLSKGTYTLSIFIDGKWSSQNFIKK